MPEWAQSMHSRRCWKSEGISDVQEVVQEPWKVKGIFLWALIALSCNSSGLRLGRFEFCWPGWALAVVAHGWLFSLQKVIFTVVHMQYYLELCKAKWPKFPNKALMQWYGGESSLLFKPVALLHGLGSVEASLCHRGFHGSDAAALKYLPSFLKECKEPLGLFRCYA